MQVDEGFVEELRVTTKLLEVRADVAVGNLRRFLHHIAELPGELEPTIQGMNARGFDRQGGAAHAGPGQAGNYAGAGQHLFIAEYRMAQRGFEVFRAEFDHRFRIVDQLHHRFAHQFAHLLFQLTHAGFTGVTVDQGFECGVADAQAAFGHAGLFQQFRPQVTLGDGDFFFSDVAGQANHFHTVE